ELGVDPLPDRRPRDTLERYQPRRYPGVHMKVRNPKPRERGFSLMEVMAAVIVICIGMLGVAKMQALALSNSNTSRMRSLAAIEAASIASAMHSNRQYWSTAVALELPMSATLTYGTAPAVASTDAALQAQATTDLGVAPPNQCLNITCTAVQLAAFDLARWTYNVGTVLPNSTTVITCPLPAAGVLAPVSCTIRINWAEKAVGMTQNTATQAANAALVPPQYTLQVEP
ncbi:MAG TPA: prepilin-type N-terminal cleavage/methylation domain-containing protein, partial [Candidatus Dormibacteraeota bacterium]|nr:prepilin-type N-terminal cleavage/methylation domain-containing protein [Candidatus Dormibacteraeota bacterium]